MTLGARLQPALEDLAQLLTDAGCATSSHPGRVPVPGGYLRLRSIDLLTLADGSGRLRVELFLVVGDQAAPGATTALGELLDAALQVVSPDDAVTAESLILPDITTPLPALRLPVDIDI